MFHQRRLPLLLPHSPALVRHLNSLPPELVHPILDSLPLSSIIPLIISTSAPHFERCILSHIVYGRLLTPESLLELKEYALLHAERCQPSKCPTLGISPTWDTSWINPERDQYAVIRAHMVAPLLGDLRRTFTPYLPVLRRYSSEEIPDQGDWNMISPGDLRRLWDILSAAQAGFRAAKVAQLTRMADMLERNPQMLCPTIVRSQEPRTKSSVAHNIAILRRAASGTEADGHTAFFRYTRLPWAAHDRYLRMFLKVLARFPHKTPANALSLATQPQKQGRTPARVILGHPYPANVADDITTALAGLENMYQHPHNISVAHQYPPEAPPPIAEYTLGPPAPDTPFKRTVNTKKPHGLDQPRFDFDGVGVGRGGSWLPFDEREFEWLEAFCRTCRWMLDRMTNVPWASTDERGGNMRRISVSRYWREKVENSENVVWRKPPIVWAEGENGLTAWKDGDERLKVVKGKVEKEKNGKEEKGKGLEK